MADLSSTLSKNAFKYPTSPPPLSMSSCTLTRNTVGHHHPRSSPRVKRPRLPPLILRSIDEEATPSEYDIGGLDLGAESPMSTSSTTNLLENNTLVQWAEVRAPHRNAIRRTPSFSKERQRSSSQRDDDRDCGICFEYSVRPCRTLCCGKIFCTEHLADWLHGPNAEGRCPHCENACSLVGGTLPLSPAPLLQFPLSPHTKRQTLTPSNYCAFHPSALTIVQSCPNDSQQYHPLSTQIGKAAIKSRAAQSLTQSTTSSTSTGLSSELAGSSSDGESIRQHYRRLRMKRSLSQLGSGSTSPINLSTTPFSQSWGAISRLTSIITFLMFIYKLLS